MAKKVAKTVLSVTSHASLHLPGQFPRRPNVVHTDALLCLYQSGQHPLILTSAGTEQLPALGTPGGPRLQPVDLQLPGSGVDPGI
jgi:hypothetical protein